MVEGRTLARRPDFPPSSFSHGSLDTSPAQREEITTNGTAPMGTAPTPVLVSTYGTGNALDGKITRDAIDDLVAGMSSHLLIYLRSVKMSTPAASFVDSLGNPISLTTPSDLTFTSSDSSFNNHSSIAFNQPSGGNLLSTTAGAIGIGAPPLSMTNSFTFMAGIHAGNSSGGNCLYGDNAGTSGTAVTGFYLNSAGNLVGLIGGSNLSFGGSQPLLAAGSTGAVWLSYDALTNTVRAGVNNGIIALTAVSAQTRNGAGTSTVCNPFGYGGGGAAGNQKFNRWTLWNKAFMNGAVPADDAAFTNLVAQYAAYI